MYCLASFLKPWFNFLSVRNVKQKIKVASLFIHPQIVTGLSSRFDPVILTTGEFMPAKPEEYSCEAFQFFPDQYLSLSLLHVRAGRG